MATIFTQLYSMAVPGPLELLEFELNPFRFEVNAKHVSGVSVLCSCQTCTATCCDAFTGGKIASRFLRREVPSLAHRHRPCACDW